MKKRWIKDGVFASNTIKLNGCVVCNPTEDMLREAGYEEYQEPELTEQEKLQRAKQQKLQEIENYDQSDAVNSFTLNGKQRWLGDSMRKSLAYAAKVLKEKGYDNMTIWFDENGTTESETIPVDSALDMLSTLEVYAKETNNVTHEHKKAVQDMTSVDDIEYFDITADYPQKLTYQI